MKHAGPKALDQLADVLAGLRKEGALRERKRGTFYLKASAFLHFHEDPAGLFADVKGAAGWERLPADTQQPRDEDKELDPSAVFAKLSSLKAKEPQPGEG